MYADKSIFVVFLPPLKFVGVSTNQGRTGKIQGSWDLDRSVAVLTAVGVPVDYVFLDIGVNVRRAVICLECDCEEA